MCYSEKPLIIIGGGGHAQVLIDILKKVDCEIIGITEPKLSKGNFILDIPVLGGDEAILNYPAETVRLVNGIGSVGDPALRRNVFIHFKSRKYSFISVIHPSAILAMNIELEEGVQVMAGAIIQSGSKIGVNTIINTGSVVDHNCCIGEHVHIAPGVTISGDVSIGSHSHIGTGAVVIQGIEIGNSCLIGAGSTVVQNITPNTKVMGVPAKPVKS
ncbi:MAG: acetyltransferase [Desulfamplus sp.]|nr:acetyltransferase [Desulfamplus sp.]